MRSTWIERLTQDPISKYPSATVACFDATTGELPRRCLDANRNKLFLERLAVAGVPAVLIASSTGHGHARTVDELEEWLESSADAELGSTVKMALLRPEDGEAANRHLIDRLCDLDYPVVFVRPGTNLPANAADAEVAENMSVVVEAAASRGLAVGVYSIPDVSGVRLSVEAVLRLLETPGGERIVAVKVTEADYEASTRRFLEEPRLKHLKIVQGWDPHLSRALLDGPRLDTAGRQRCGVTSGPMSLAVFQYLHILEMAERGHWDEVTASQQAVTALFESMQDDPAKFADLQRAKFIMGLGNPLTSTIDTAQLERVLSALEALPRDEDRARLARSLDLMEDGPYHDRLRRWC